MKFPKTLLTLALLSTAALGQAPQISQVGGSTTGLTTIHVKGTPLQAYGVILSTNEVTTEVLPGVFIDLALDNIGLTFTLPGFFSIMNISGEAIAPLTFSDPGLAGFTFSAQALTGPFFDTPSNLIRITLADAGSITTTIGAPIAPIDGGAVVSDANNDLIFAGGSGTQAQRYDVDLEEFSSAGTTFSTGLTAQSTILNDGRILFTGGFDATGFPTDAAAIYDPVSTAVTPLTMGSKRVAHRATLLNDGRVWITGGISTISVDILTILNDPIQGLAAFSGLLSTSEFFNPLTDSFSAGPALPETRGLHSATLMNDGKVLIVGGMSTVPILNLATMSDTARLYDPVANTFGLPITYPGARLLHTAMLQTDGSVLIAGGLELHGLIEFLTTGNIFALTIGSLSDVLRYEGGFFGSGFNTVGTLSESRAAAGMAYTTGGDILIAGGMHINLGPLLTVATSLSNNTDLYTQGSGTAPAADMANTRYEPHLVNLPDGTMLIVGGSFQLTGGLNIDAEVYQP